MQVVVNGLLTRFEKTGKGERTVLLLHGWGDRAAGLANIQNELAKKFTVIAPDLPGFGGSQVPPADWDLTNYAEFVRDFLKKLNLKPYAVAGHSFGGAIAIRALGKNILNANKLILLASTGVRDDYKDRAKVFRLLTKTGKALSSPLPKSAKNRLRRKVYDLIGSDMLVVENLQPTFKKVVADDVQADAGKINVPTLLVYGEQDKATPVSFGEKFHELIDGSTLEVLPGAGHFVHKDRPKAVQKAIMEFLT